MFNGYAIEKQELKGNVDSEKSVNNRYKVIVFFMGWAV